MKLAKEKWPMVRRLYQKGFSAREISEMYKLSIGCVYYFFRKDNVVRRSPSQNSVLLFNKKPSSFKIKKNLTSKERLLKTAGIMLYWAEGSNWFGGKIVDFANSKPMMIKIFLYFLRKVCGVSEKRLRVYLYCFSHQNSRELIDFWSKETNIPTSQFTKPYIKNVQSEDKNTKMKYGLLHIRYNDKKLLLLIQKWIKEFGDSY